MNKPPYRTLNSEIAWSCPWFSVRRDEIVFPNGRPGVYNVVEHPGAVWVVPVTTAGDIVLIHNYRYEVLTVHALPAVEALDMARSGGITDAPSALALLQAEPFLDSI